MNRDRIYIQKSLSIVANEAATHPRILRIRDEELRSLIPPKTRKMLTRKDELLLAVVAQILKEDPFPSVDRQRIGAFVGTSFSQVDDYFPMFSHALCCISHDQERFDSQKLGAEVLPSINPLIALKTLSNAGLAHLCQIHNIKGRNANFIDGEASALHALDAACLALSHGSCDHAIVAAVHSPGEPFQIAEWKHQESLIECAAALVLSRSASTAIASIDALELNAVRGFSRFGECEALLQLCQALENREPRVWTHVNNRLVCTLYPPMDSQWNCLP